MSIQKPNCSTCTNPKCPVMATPGHKPDEVGWYPEIVSSIRECGCLSHPGARECLMAPVIAELERLSKQNVGTQYRYALEEATALIRDGVKHE